jgi:abequosyltransferase
MTSTQDSRSTVRVSICVGTHNRAHLISQTLDSIMGQLTDDCEIVVSDDASTDGTEEILSGYLRRCAALRYFKQGTNLGVDGNYDYLVGVARGRYCWLMTDDDLLKPGAIAAVLTAIQTDPCLITVNAEIKDLSMQRILLPRYNKIESDRVYRPCEVDRFFSEDGWYTTHLASIVILREVWLARDRQRYYGSQFLHVGVIFQKPLPGTALVIATPYISIRAGNCYVFTRNAFEVFAFFWPSLVWSLAVSDQAKARVTSREPWRGLGCLLSYRALGSYSLEEYRRLIRPQIKSAREALLPILVALLPGMLTNIGYVCYYSLKEPMAVPFLRQSRFYPGNSAVLGALLRLRWWHA